MKTVSKHLTKNVWYIWAGAERVVWHEHFESLLQTQLGLKKMLSFLVFLRFSSHFPFVQWLFVAICLLNPNFPLLCLLKESLSWNPSFFSHCLTDRQSWYDFVPVHDSWQLRHPCYQCRKTFCKTFNIPYAHLLLSLVTNSRTGGLLSTHF